MQPTPTIYVIKIVKPQKKKILSNMRLCNICNKCNQKLRNLPTHIYLKKNMSPKFLQMIEIENFFFFFFFGEA